jgi:hypothetical protein
VAVSVEERQFLLGEVAKQAGIDLRALWAATAELSNIDFAAYIRSAYPEIALQWSEVTAHLAATWFEASAATTYVAKLAPAITLDRLLSSVDWALSATGTDGLTRLDGSLQRAVFDGARETTLLNVGATGSTWARYASANACEFCRLMAIRGDIYTSKEAAAHVVGRGADLTAADHTAIAAGESRRAHGHFMAGGRKPRGTQAIGDKYHDHCHCLPIEVHAGQTYEPPPYVAQWEDEYRKAFDAVPNGTSYRDNGVLKAVMANMRNTEKAAQG